MLNFTKTFLKWRKQHPALIRGNLAFSDTHKDLLTFTRSQDGVNIFCAFNFSPDTVTIPLDGQPLEGHGLEYTTQGQTIALPGFGGVFVKKAG